MRGEGRTFPCETYPTVAISRKLSVCGEYNVNQYNNWCAAYKHIRFYMVSHTETLVTCTKTAGSFTMTRNVPSTNSEVQRMPIHDSVRILTPQRS